MCNVPQGLIMASHIPLLSVVCEHALAVMAGSFPATWSLDASAYKELQLLDVSYNALSGSLPADGALRYISAHFIYVYDCHILMPHRMLHLIASSLDTQCQLNKCRVCTSSACWPHCKQHLHVSTCMSLLV